MAWDPVVRISHWLVALLFLANYFWLEAGETAHEWAGYGLAAVLAVRLIWGLTGPAPARLSSFLPTPARLKTQFANLKGSYAAKSGHTPLSGLMILSSWTLLLVCALFGWLQTTDRYWGVEWVADLHSLTADVLIAISCLHVITVVILQYWLKRSLIRPMLMGNPREE